MLLEEWNFLSISYYFQLSWNSKFLENSIFTNSLIFFIICKILEIRLIQHWLRMFCTVLIIPVIPPAVLSVLSFMFCIIMSYPNQSCPILISLVPIIPSQSILPCPCHACLVLSCRVLTCRDLSCRVLYLSLLSSLILVNHVPSTSYSVVSSMSYSIV